MKKFLTILIVFYFSIIIFMPKESLYFTLKNRLKNEQIVIVEDSLNDNFLSLNSEGVSIFYDGIDSVKIENFSIKPYLLYNSMHAQNISPSNDLKKMFKFSASSLDISYAIWDYQNINIKAEGNFGEVVGTIDVLTRTLKLILEPTLRFEKSPLIKQYFKKSEEGYIYESKI